ncbi:MAG TPA: hypothetical protein VJ546_01150 [Bacillales bacterium]|nr:hypothetical protein [Bacillales bacterium]
MKESISQKEKLLMMMTEIYNQLEELESMLEVSFTVVRDNWIDEEKSRIAKPCQKISSLEAKLADENVENIKDQNGQAQKSASLKLELGMN